MDLRLIYAILLTLAPLTELRVGLPLAMTYGISNQVPLFLIFTLIILVNLILILILFLLIDSIHKFLGRFSLYRTWFDRNLARLRNKVSRIGRKYQNIGYTALIIFVAIPLPGTGVWSACIITWILGLDRLKSTVAISMGVILAGIIVLLGSLGIFSLIY